MFTSPVLAGTNGLLHVSKVYLEGLQFVDLELDISKDGKIAAYSCENFETRGMEIRNTLMDNILYPSSNSSYG